MRAVPWEVWLAFGSMLIYVLSLALTVFDLVSGMALFAFVAFPIMIGAALVLAGRLVFSKPNSWRRLSFALLAACLISFFCGSLRACMDLHLTRRIYLSGGADALRDWAQGLMDECKPIDPNRRLGVDDIPSGVKAHLNDRVTANSEMVVIKMGGGPFQYWVNIHRPLPGRRPAITYSYD